MHGFDRVWVNLNPRLERGEHLEVPRFLTQGIDWGYRPSSCDGGAAPGMPYDVTATNHAGIARGLRQALLLQLIRGWQLRLTTESRAFRSKQPRSLVSSSRT